MHFTQKSHLLSLFWHYWFESASLWCVCNSLTLRCRVQLRDSMADEPGEMETSQELTTLDMNSSLSNAYANSSNVTNHSSITYYPYYQHSLSVATALTLAYLFIFLLCMVGNGLVCLIVLENRRMRTVTNLFILNLAVSDLLVGVFCIPTTLVDNLITGTHLCNDTNTTREREKKHLNPFFCLDLLLELNTSTIMAKCKKHTFRATLQTVMKLWPVRSYPLHYRGLHLNSTVSNLHLMLKIDLFWHSLAEANTSVLMFALAIGLWLCRANVNNGFSSELYMLFQLSTQCSFLQ